jgi:broad specificity phosphatase PhoE
MSMPAIYLIRHGETDWSRLGKHTGISDIPLSVQGRYQAARLRPELVAENFELVLTSPLGRARETCELAGLGALAAVDADLMEWNYGEYEGLTSDQIHVLRPGWTIFNDGGGRGGETPEQVVIRVDRIVGRMRAVRSSAVLFAHAHVLRVIAARWLGLEPRAGANFLLDTATVCVLTSDRGVPAIKRWNAAPAEPSFTQG